jgi:hypothetical protein
MALIKKVLNQTKFPGVGDIDDCWVVATVQAALGANPGAHKPNATEFRKHAGDPDDQHKTDGGSFKEILNGARGTWPKMEIVPLRGVSFSKFSARVKKGGAASLAVDSGDLPSRMRFGFMDPHQVAVEFDGGWKLANPLAKQDSAPVPITEAELRKAIDGFDSHGVFAVFFPVRQKSMGDAVADLEDDMLGFTILENASGFVTLADNGHSAILLKTGTLFPLGKGQRKEVYAKIKLDKPFGSAKDNPATPGNESDRQTAWLVGGPDPAALLVYATGPIEPA